MLKKAGVVAATAAGLTMMGGTAFAAEQPAPTLPHGQDQEITYADAYDTFITGGGAMGYGAASLVAAAYTGIALTPALVADSFDDQADELTGSFSGTLPE